MRFLALVALAAFLALAACGDGDSPEEPTPAADESLDLTGLVITMSRGPCLGACPVYTLTLRGDGSVDYHGTNNVDALGLRSGSVTLDNLRRLVESLEGIDFFELPADSDCATTDVPRTIISGQLGGDNNSVIHCSERDETTPIGQLVKIEERIDDMTASLRWTGPPRTPDWDGSDRFELTPVPSELERVILMRGAHYPEPGVSECNRLPCVDYSVTIFRSGFVEYRGANNVNVIGIFTTKISSDEVFELLSRFDEVGFFDLPSDFHCQSAPATATITIVTLSDRANIVERCHVDDPPGRLEPLRLLEVEIAELVDLEGWVGEENLP